ncbi:hypothetical protein [Flavobacterium sp.]|uniref:hypothetical protein n=1 Tax=Flavobacterium sp. TaxID=239 RepID=UPI00260CEEE7|nr:hypothetical protein [Flavobacterium sp.]
MKKIALFLAISLTVACSGDSDSPKSTKVLLDKTVTTYDDGSTVEATYFYDDDFLIKTTYSDGRSDEYTYEDEYLTQMKELDGTTVTATHRYEYFSINRLKKYTIQRGDITSYQSYEYLNNGDIYVRTNDLLRDGYNSSDGHFKFRMTGSSISYIEAFIPTELLPIYTVNILYDTKKSPMVNVWANSIMSMAKLQGGDRNIRLYSSLGGNMSSQSETTYTYNDEGYPTQSVTTISDNTTYTIEYFYK